MNSRPFITFKHGEQITITTSKHEKAIVLPRDALNWYATHSEWYLYVPGCTIVSLPNSVNLNFIHWKSYVCVTILTVGFLERKT